LRFGIAAALPMEDDPELLQALAEVRAHLSEIYRLYHRILRNQRAAIRGLMPDGAGAVRAPRTARSSSPESSFATTALLRIRHALLRFATSTSGFLTSC
jgi:hypothetical protein